ncbi:hypothetical protein E2C01_057476 [Portunus trituberculatus]|uniref:Uncharacterized protein n=1 Tax=Portunus trituberculatus TaxID=210409 RepID=A0A5B7H2I3_PORTR|nr:hypothetical protein [Portunus trituberculatus]
MCLEEDFRRPWLCLLGEAGGLAGGNNNTGCYLAELWRHLRIMTPGYQDGGNTVHLSLIEAGCLQYGVAKPYLAPERAWLDCAVFTQRVAELDDEINP